MQKQYEIHPIANVFPMMSKDEFKALKSDIKEHGLREPIVFWKNMLVDGRNRLKACVELGLEADESELMDETDPVAWVISHNLHRRHLTTSQRSDVAAKIATMRSGTRTDLGSKDTKSIDDAAKQMKVSPASVKRAKKVHAKGSEAVKQAVEQGELTVSVAAEFIKAVPDKAEQEAIVNEGVQAVKKKVKNSKPKKPALPKQEEELVWVDVEDDEPQDDCKLIEFKKFWSKCSDLSKTAIRVWIEDQFTR
jgi:ParB-like chromosome segregation protein Spo0J